MVSTELFSKDFFRGVVVSEIDDRNGVWFTGLGSKCLERLDEAIASPPHYDECVNRSSHP